MHTFKSYRTKKDTSASDLLDLSRKIETGFPSPATDHLEKALRLEDLIVRRPTSTFYVRAEGNAMKASGIHNGDILVVDRSLNAKHECLLVLSIDDEVLIRRFIRLGNKTFLTTDDASLAPIPITPHTQWMIWGVVTHLIHRFS